MFKIALTVLLAVVCIEVGSWIYYASLKPESTLDRLTEVYEASILEPERPTGGLLKQIVIDRRSCQRNNVAYIDLEECRLRYLNEVVDFANSSISSPPDYAAFVDCLGECPSVGAMCSGTYGSHEEVGAEACVAAEVGCIERCLEEHWRGETAKSLLRYWGDKEE